MGKKFAIFLLSAVMLCVTALAFAGCGRVTEPVAKELTTGQRTGTLYSTYALDVNNFFDGVDSNTVYSATVNNQPGKIVDAVAGGNPVKRLRVGITSKDALSVKVTATNTSGRNSKSADLTFDIIIVERNMNPWYNSRDIERADGNFYAWNKDPVIKGEVFYENFSQGFDAERWRLITAGEAWPTNGNTMDASLVSWTDNAAEVAKHGGTEGGMAILGSLGLHHPRVINDTPALPAPSHRPVGSGIVTQQAFGPGFYEVRMKPVPRTGACSAIWTFWDPRDGSNRYSEIDIEFPGMGGNNRVWWATTYAEWYEGIDKDSVDTIDTRIVNAPWGYNDGEWRQYAFEWRTDEANDDKAIIWYIWNEELEEYEQCDFIEGPSVPTHEAWFWIGNWFPFGPDGIAWVGNADYEEAFMYIDWVRITQYTDPVEPGAHTTNFDTVGAARKVNTIPVNNYISNGDFAFGGESGPVPPGPAGGPTDTARGWRVERGEIFRGGRNDLEIHPGTRLTQLIQRQIFSFRFTLNIKGEIEMTGGNALRVYVYFGTDGTEYARSQELAINKLGAFDESLDILVIDGIIRGANEFTQDIIVVLETEAGVIAVIDSVSMFMK